MPLYLRTFPPDPLPTPADPTYIQFQEVIYNSLDVVEERLSSVRNTSRDGDGFLGCLAVVGATSVYGAVTNSGHRMMIGVRGEGEIDAGVRVAFGRLREALVRRFLDGLNCGVGGKKFEGAVIEVIHRFEA